MSGPSTTLTSEQLLAQGAISALKQGQAPEEVVPALVAGIRKLVSGSPTSIISVDDLEMLRPDIQIAIKKFMSAIQIKPLPPYEAKRGGGQHGILQEWITKNLIEGRGITQDELNRIPFAFLKKIHPRLATAIYDSKRSK